MRPVTGAPLRGTTPRGTKLEVLGHSGCGLLIVALVGDKERSRLCCSANAITPDTPADKAAIEQLVQE